MLSISRSIDRCRAVVASIPTSCMHSPPICCSILGFACTTTAQQHTCISIATFNAAQAHSLCLASHSGGHCGAVVWVWTVAKPTNVLQKHSQQADRPLLRTCHALRPVRSQAQSQLMWQHLRPCLQLRAFMKWPMRCMHAKLRQPHRCREDSREACVAVLQMTPKRLQIRLRCKPSNAAGFAWANVCKLPGNPLRSVGLQMSVWRVRACGAANAS